jgi:hypothetical protein
VASSGRGVSSWEKIEAVLGNEEMYRLADVIPDPEPAKGGRPRDFPTFAYLFFGLAIDIYNSARQAEAELADPWVWQRICDFVRSMFPDDERMWLPPDRQLRSFHWRYFRDAYLTGSDEFEALRAVHEEVSIEQAIEMHLCDPNGPGSVNHPDPTRIVFGDGKVIAPLYKAKPATEIRDKVTGEIRQVRADPDAELHVTGSGEPAWGTKTVLVAVRGEDVHQRMILTFGHVPKGLEAKVALEAFDRILPKLPGCQATLWDGAMRGIHNQHIIRKHGKVPISPVTAKSGGRRSRQPRVERSAYVGRGTIHRDDGRVDVCNLYTHGGVLGLGVTTEDGEMIHVPVERQTLRWRGEPGSYRLYGDYRVPESEGGGTIKTIPLYQTDEDRATEFNRTEHLRPIPPGDPDYQRIYPRRSDAESINRGHDDKLYLRRAHSVGAPRQMVDVAMHALLVNSLAIKRHRDKQANLGRNAA